jgi:hypothetical protein
MRYGPQSKLPESSSGYGQPPGIRNSLLAGLRWIGWLLKLTVVVGVVLIVAGVVRKQPVSDWESALTDIPLREGAYIQGKVGDFRMVGIDGMPLRVFGIDWPDSPDRRTLWTESPTGNLGLHDWVIISLPYSEANDEHVRLISQHSRIRSLALDGTRITDAGLKYLRGVAHLKALSLGATEISDAGAESLGEIRSLQSLDLRGTRISNAALPSLAALRRLRSLNLSGTQVDAAGLIHLQRLDCLETLVLNDASLDDGAVAALCGLTSLREIYLRGTCISEEGIAELASLPRLVLCDFDGGLLTRRDLDALRRRGGEPLSTAK